MQFFNSFSTVCSLNNVLAYEFNLFNNSSKIEDFTYNIQHYSCNTTVQENYLNYFLNSSELKILQKTNKKTMNVYQGHHSFSSLINFNYILPSTFFLEKNALYLNILGFTKLSQFVLTPPKQARNDLQILLIFFLNYLNSYNICVEKFNFYEITKFIRKSLNKLSPIFTSHMRIKIKKQIINNIFLLFDIYNGLLNHFFLSPISFKQSQLVNFLLPNHLVNLSLNINLANQEHLYYFSSFK